MIRHLIKVLVVPVLLVAAQAQAATAVSGSAKVDGLSCPFCVHGLEKNLHQLSWVQHAAVQIDDGRVDFTVRPGATPNIMELRKAVKKSGFTPRGVTLTATGRVVRSDSAVLLKVGDRVSLTLNPGPKRKDLLSKLGSSGRRVRIVGTADTSGGQTRITIRSFGIV